jgi:hypothetical protein
MRYLTLALLMFCLLPGNTFAEDDPAQPPTILSIIPGQGNPGGTVVISGAGFTPGITLYLGIDEVPLRAVTATQLRFEIPQLAVGNYALYLRQKSGVASKAYSFTVIPVKPTVSGITPDSISFCAAGAERQVSVKGRNFLEGARVLLDGAIIRGSRLSSEEMTFQAPQVPGGLHQVQVRNPEDALSAAVALMITTRPEIQSVSQGNDYVNYYELIIDGVNFQQGSSLVVDGRKVQALPSEHDRLVYNSCTRLVYQRYPYDFSVKSFQLSIVNPSGEESGSFTVTAP